MPWKGCIPHFPKNCSTDVEYWDKVAEQSFDFETRTLIGNPQKWRCILQKILNINLDHKRVLEIGCGAGIVSLILRQVYVDMDYIATDISPKFCDIFETLHGRRPILAKANQLPIEDKSIDCIIALDVLEHIMIDERIKSYQEIDRILKNHASIVIDVPFHRSIHDKKYDPGFTMDDLSDICHICHMYIKYFKEFYVNDKISHFWILER